MRLDLSLCCIWSILIEPLSITTFINNMPLGPGDLLFHHAIGVGLHVSILILLKGSLDASGSKLIPDKLRFAVSFACDGPIRGGTCDISAFDSNYLGLFWMLNTRGWITFYFHWKHLQLSEYRTMDQSSTYLNGWFGDYLFFNSTTLMNGYNTFGPIDYFGSSLLGYRLHVFNQLAWLLARINGYDTCNAFENSSRFSTIFG